MVTGVPNGTTKILIGLIAKTLRRGSSVYTHKFRSYDNLMCCRYRLLKIDHSKRFTSEKVYINSLGRF